MTESIPDRGLLQSFLDRELDSDDAPELERALERDPGLRAELASLEAASLAFGAALEDLDVTPIWPDERPWRRADPEGRRRRSWARAAAVLVAVAAGTASALPGSPVRSWLATTWQRVTAASPTDRLVEPPPVADPVRPGISVPSDLGRLTVVLPSLSPGTEVVVRLGEPGPVWVRAGEGAGYTTSPGRVEVASPGRVVEVVLPRDLPEATVEVGGEVFLRKLGPGLVLTGPVADSTGAEVRFRVAPVEGVGPGGSS